MKALLHYDGLCERVSGTAFQLWMVFLLLSAASQATPLLRTTANSLQQSTPFSVSGKVTDVNGQPVVSATILEKGTSNAVVADLNGDFKITVTGPAAVLIFQSVGFITQEKTVGDQILMTVILADDTQLLDEIVVVGYGTLNKREVSSTITHVSGKDLLSVGGNNALMSLQGKVAGLTIVNTATGDPNSAPSIQLRGVSSRQAGLGPLYVVDGIPGANIDNINQVDIASIDVLKGGAASAIYGTRGSNGVILITTKKGSSREQTTYSNYFALDIPNNEIETLSADEFITHRGQDLNNYGAKTDWMNAITRKSAFSQRHNLAVSGGNSRTNYYVSGDYREADGIDLRSSKMSYGARANISHTPENNLYTVTFNIAPRFQKSNNAEYYQFAQALTANPTQPIYNVDNPRLYHHITSALGPWNPVEEAKTVLTGNEAKYLDWSAAFKLNLMKNWSTQVTLSQSNSNFFSFYFRPSTNTQAIFNNGGRSSASRSYTVNDTKTLEWITNYSFNIKKHSVKFLAGYSHSYFNNQGLSGSNNEFPTDAFTYNNLGAGLYNLVAGQNNVGSYQNDSRLIAFFSRANYSYNNELFFSASIRQEGSSKFGKNNKWGDFPAFSVAWDMHVHSFINQFEWINGLKIKADYGLTGNQDFGNYLSLDTYGGFGYYLYNGVYYQVYGPTQNTSYDLRWETAKSYNAGIDFELFNNRLSGSINYYIKKNEDLLGTYEVPLPPNPLPTVYANVGSMRNSGIELQLTAIPVKMPNFSYEVSFAGYNLENKFISFSDDTYLALPFVDAVNLPAPGSPGTIQRLQEGKRIGSFYMYKSAGVDNIGRLLVYNKANDVIPANQAKLEDKRFVGNGLPKYYLNLGNTFRYKNWDATVYFRGVFDYDIFNTNAFYIGTPATADGVNVLQSAYGNGKYAKLTNDATTSVASDYFLESGDFVKLDNITIGYTYNSQSKYFKSVRVFVTGTNLALFTKYTGGDPEKVSVNGLYPGVNPALSYFPSTLQVISGLQVNF